jgi:hypothetical protein
LLAASERAETVATLNAMIAEATKPSQSARERHLRVRQCKVCNHPERARIEMLRVGGAGLDALAKEFRASKDSLFRHFKNHFSDRRRAELMAGPARVEGLANAAAAESKGLLEYLGITRSVLFSQFLACAEAGDRAGVSLIAGRLLESLRELGRLTGELRQLSGITVNNTLNIVSSPGFLGRILRRRRQSLICYAIDSRPDMPKPNGGHPPMMLIEGEALHASA